VTKKQAQALIVVEYFVPTPCRNDNPVDMITNWRNDLGLADIIEDPHGMTPEDAFFLKTDRGKTPPAVTDLKRFVQLLYGQRAMAMHEKMYTTSFKEATLFPFEFEDDPPEVQVWVEKVYKKCQAEAEAALRAKEPMIRAWRGTQ